MGETNDEAFGIYLVTARHVAQALGSTFAIRFNKIGGGAATEIVENADWTYSVEKTEDVAVLHYGCPDWADCKPIPGSVFIQPFDDENADRRMPRSEGVGVGDLASVIGLFRLLHGKRRNLPVVHTGHIALLPQDEKVPVTDSRTGETYEAEGYLVEAHTLPGLSGAPVFVRGSEMVAVRATRQATGSIPQELYKEQDILARIHTPLSFLGIWRSSWEGDPSDLAAAQKGLSGVRVPLGFGLVIPGRKIAETLNLPKLLDSRRAEHLRRQRAVAMTEDVALPAKSEPPTMDVPDSDKERFTALLEDDAIRLNDVPSNSPSPPLGAERSGEVGDSRADIE
jgi:hypothetical protein